MQRLAPNSESEVADVVRGASAPFGIAGHGTKRGFGRPVNAETFLDVGALSGIVKYEPEELVLTARAATPMTEIEAALAEKNQMLAFEPAEWGPLFGESAASTLGGIVAANACGARRVKAGAVRDSVIGCRFVNGRGEIVKAGGHVIKNVTGFDIPKLMAGAFGTLGVMTEVTLRVVPKPARVAAAAIFCGGEDGLRVLREAAKLPVDATGLSYCPASVLKRLDMASRGDGAALIRVEGTESAVAEKIAALRTLFAANDLDVLDDARTHELFRAIGNGAVFVGEGADIWRLSVPPIDAYAAVEASGAQFGYADWVGGLLWLGLPASKDTAARLRAITVRFGGHATLMRASDDARRKLAVFEPESPARAEITRSVKDAFDPKRLFNPGLMFEGV